jgi:hypothetical protein
MTTRDELLREAVEALRAFAEFQQSLLEWRHSDRWGAIQEAWPEHKPVMRRTYPANADAENRVELYKSNFDNASSTLAKIEAHLKENGT